MADRVIRTDAEFNVNACFLFYAQVKEWREVLLAQAVNDEAELEHCIVEVASGFGIDAGQPFTFMDPCYAAAGAIPHFS